MRCDNDAFIWREVGHAGVGDDSRILCLIASCQIKSYQEEKVSCRRLAKSQEGEAPGDTSDDGYAVKVQPAIALSRVLVVTVSLAFLTWPLLCGFRHGKWTSTMKSWPGSTAFESKHRTLLFVSIDSA